MIKCQDCGAVLEDSFQFCPRCSASTSTALPDPGGKRGSIRAHYCGKCGAKLPGGAKFCLICGTGAGTPPPVTDKEPERIVVPKDITGVFPKQKQRQEPVPFYHKRKNRFMSLVALWMCAIIVLAAAGSWAWDVVPYLLSDDKTRADNAILYVQDGTTLRLKSASSSQPLTIAEGFSVSKDIPVEQLAQASGNGRYLAYLYGAKGDEESFSGDLYLLDLSRVTRPDASEEEARLVATGVQGGFAFSPGGSYMAYLTEEKELYITNYEESWPVAADVEGILAVSDSQVLYSRLLSRGGGIAPARMELLLAELTQAGGEPFRVDSDVSEVLGWTDDLNNFQYIRVRQSADTGTYVYDIGAYDRARNQRQLIASNIAGVVDSSPEGNRVLYLLERGYELDYEDLIDDDMAAMDEIISEPDLIAYPDLQEYYDRYGQLPTYYGIEDGTEESYPREVRINQQLDDYQEDLAQYEEKLERDKLRSRLESALRRTLPAEVKQYELILYADGEERVVSGDLVALRGSQPVVAGSVEHNYMLYVTANLEDVEQVRLSALASNPENFLSGEWLRQQLKMQLWYSVGGRSPSLVTETDRYQKIYQPVVTDRMDGIYFLMKSKSASETAVAQLYYSQLRGGIPETAYLLDRGVDRMLGAQTFGGRLLYTKNDDGLSCTLYAAVGGSGEPLSYSMNSGREPSIENGGKTLFYYENYRDNAGDLYMTTEGTALQKRMLSADVKSFYYKADSLIYILKGRELYAYNGGALTLIDSGVSYVLPMEEEREEPV